MFPLCNFVLSSFKPAASRKTLLLVAALIWTVVGVFLFLRGGRVLVVGQHYYMFAAAVILGSIKGIVVLKRSALKNIARILDKRDGVCLGAVFSGQTWGLILLMVVMGKLLRAGGFPQLYGFIVSGVGVGLLLASIVIWREWKNYGAI